MSNSPLVNYTRLSPNNSGRRTHVIDTVSIHCMAGNLTVESCGALFAKSSTKASSNYGIGSDGRIALYVDESNRSWCTSNSANDNRAVTIEVANTDNKEPFPVSEAAYESLIRLLVDICQRNGIEKLVWKTDKASRVNHVGGANMTVHRDYANKSCPGQWLYEHHGKIAADVNARLHSGVTVAASTGYAEITGQYQVTTRTAPLNCRDTPGGSVIGTFPIGATVTASYECGEWLYVTDGKVTGWASKEYLTEYVPHTNETKEENDMDIDKLTDEQCYEILQKAQRHAATLPLPDWATGETDEAWQFEQAGPGQTEITDGTRPMGLVTRLECALMAYRAALSAVDTARAEFIEQI